MRRFAFGGVIAMAVAMVAVLVYFELFHTRTTQRRVTAAVYARFGAGPRIRCVSQDGVGGRWNCSSPQRWGDDPSCIPVEVDWHGNLTIADEPVICEG
jgi:hypothetical protein